MRVGKPSMTFLGRNVYFLDIFIANVRKGLKLAELIKTFTAVGSKISSVLSHQGLRIPTSFPGSVSYPSLVRTSRSVETGRREP